MRSILSIWVLAMLCSVSLAESLPAEAVSAPAKAAVADEADLTFFNRKVFTFRSTLIGVSAHDRAKRAQARIVDQLAIAGPHVAATKPDLLGYQVHINGAAIFWVSPEDRNPEREDSLEATAQRAAATLQQAINDSAESRNLEALLRGLALAGAATVLVTALGWVISRIHRVVARVLAAATEKHAGQLQVGGVTLLHGGRLSLAVQWLVALLYRVLLFVLFIEWLSYVLRCFPFTRAWGESLNTFLVGLVARMLGAVFQSVPDLIAALLIFFLAYWLTKALDRFFSQVQSNALQVNWLDPDVVVPTKRIAKVVVWLFALAMAYPYLPGSQTEAFKGLSVLVGLMLSLGASSMVGQAASGLILTYGRTYRKGEYVRVSDQEGTVTELGIFTTRIRTGLGEELTISNATILAGTTRNYSRAVKGQGYVLDTNVTIGYDTPWRQVHALLAEAAKRTPGILQDPPPRIFQTALSDWYPEYRLVCQARPTEPGPRATVLSALHANIQDVFNEYGVQIMSPQYFEDPPTPKVVPPSGWYAAPAVPPDAGP
ncbi:MAG: mechanosensitive ion channel protein MscS [Burkholderiales bacterium PBB4]|nr:MAG: mechanosensitive ion channel protein MscS [Burkholderiales bacterium PBB4]